MKTELEVRGEVHIWDSGGSCTCGKVGDVGAGSRPDSVLCAHHVWNV